MTFSALQSGAYGSYCTQGQGGPALYPFLTSDKSAHNIHALASYQSERWEVLLMLINTY